MGVFRITIEAKAGRPPGVPSISLGLLVKNFNPDPD
jgi:hypothetical protein